MIKNLPKISANEETNDTSRPIEKIQDDSTPFIKEGFGGLEKKIDTKFKTLNASLRKIQDSILTKIDLSAKDNLKSTKTYIDSKFNKKKASGDNNPDANPNLFKDLNSSVLALTATLESKEPKSYIDRDLNVSVSDNNASTGRFDTIDSTLTSISDRLDTLISGGNPKSEDSVFNEKSIPNELDRLNKNLEHLDEDFLGVGNRKDGKDNPILKTIIGLFATGGAMTTLLGATGTLVAGIGVLFAAGWAIKSIFGAKDFPDFMNKSGLSSLLKNVPKVIQEVADRITDPDPSSPNKPKANRQQNMTELGLGYFGRGVDELRDKSKVMGVGAQALSTPSLGLATIGFAASGFFTGGAGWAATEPLATAFLASLGSDYAQGSFKSKEISGSNSPDTKVASGWSQVASNMTYGAISPQDAYKFISTHELPSFDMSNEEDEKRSYMSLLKTIKSELEKKHISQKVYNDQLKIIQDYHNRGEVINYYKVERMQKQIKKTEDEKKRLKEKALSSNIQDTSTPTNVITQNQTTNTYIRKDINVSPEDAQYAGLIKLNNENHPWIA